VGIAGAVIAGAGIAGTAVAGVAVIGCAIGGAAVIGTGMTVGCETGTVAGFVGLGYCAAATGYCPTPCALAELVNSEKGLTTGIKVKVVPSITAIKPDLILAFVSNTILLS
jgi:hypothetical protein